MRLVLAIACVVGCSSEIERQPAPAQRPPEPARTPAEQARLAAIGDVSKQLALRRASWTVVHEVAHMFGLSHCTHFACAIAGSNSQAESDRAPLHACPVCLRKLHYAIEFDPAAREAELAKVLRTHGITDEAAWSEQRAIWIRDGKH